MGSYVAGNGRKSNNSDGSVAPRLVRTPAFAVRPAEQGFAARRDFIQVKPGRVMDDFVGKPFVIHPGGVSEIFDNGRIRRVIMVFITIPATIFGMQGRNGPSSITKSCIEARPPVFSFFQKIW